MSIDFQGIGISTKLVSLVKRFEGLSLTAYICPAGYATIGYGHVVKLPPEGLKAIPPITQTQAETFLLQDLSVARAQVLALTTASLTDGQLDALTDWVFNLGAGRYRASTLRAKVNRGEFDAVPAEIRKWVYGGGRKLPGLILRREADVALWNA